MQASDAGNPDVPMSHLALAFAGFKDAVLVQWTSRVIIEIPVAKKLGSPILINTLPVLYDNIAEALAAGTQRPSAISGTNLALAHGRERANMTEYGPQDLVHELQIFREVLFSVATENGLPLGKHGANIIGRSIEEATRESIAAYSMANKEVNESFIASLSHDLRNPLHVASVSAQLIQLKSADPAITAMAKRISRKIGETDAMIQTLLDAALLKGRMKLKLHLVNFNIMSLVEEVCADLPLLGQQVQVVGERIEGYWCRVSMKRVLENLTSNAQKYGDSSQPLTVRVSHVDDRMLVAVHNGGKPIPEAEIKRLFNSFQRIEDVEIKGWGLGLPFVQNVIESHGGSVIVDSAEGRGTTFTVNLPIDARPFVQAS